MIVPPDRTSEAVELLRSDPAVTHVIVLPGAAREPAGDVVLCDVVREGASEVLSELRELGLDHDGSIVIEEVDVALSASADAAADAVPGVGADAVVWDEIAHKTGEESRLSASFLAFMMVATMLASIGVLLDQPILIVGAMVVGPEFGPLAALCVGLTRGSWPLVRRATTALLVGFAAAMAVTVVSTWGLTAAGLVSESMLTGPRPLTDFIWRPDALSWVVGLLAGVAGMLSLTSARSGTLVGVLISVTTVPAAANAAVAVAYGVVDEAAGSTLQLLINMVAIVVAGVATLLVQRLWWRAGRVRRPSWAPPR
jgi:uncharacterized hydrophobic protein (TIGR00271 family)